MNSLVSWLVGAVPRAQLDPLDDRYYESVAPFLSRAGVRVSASSAIRVSAVYRCVSILANVLAMFPKGMYERLARGRREAPEHPLDPLISFRPNKRQSAFEFWRQVCFHLVLRQNAFVQIVPGVAGRGWVGGLVPLHPDRVYGPVELPDGRLRYEFWRDDGQKIPLIGGVDIWHLQGLSTDGLRGLSMIDLANDSIGVSIAAERHAARFFEKGVKPTGVLEHPAHLKKETAEEMSESFGRRYGGESGTGKIPVLWEGMKFTAVSMTLKDAEFLDSRKFSVTDVARWFGVPPHMVGDVERSTSWGTGIEQQGLHFLIYSLAPWIALIEQSTRYNLVVQPDRYYMKMNVQAILRMDAKTQADVFAIYLDKGVLNPNECRELLERNPREGGDEYQNPGAEITTTRAPAMEPEPMPEPEDEERGRALALSLALGRADELLAEEGQHVLRLAKEHSKDQEAWRSGVAAFYGRFAGRIANALTCPKTAAKAWCETRRGLLFGEGMVGLSDGHQSEARAALVSLALTNGGRT